MVVYLIRVPFFNLKAQYAAIKDENMWAIANVCESQLKRRLNSTD